MADFIIHQDQAKKIIEIFAKKHLTSLAKYMADKVKIKPTVTINIDGFHGFTNNEALRDNYLQDALYDYFKDNINFNLASFYELKILNNSWQADIFLIYVRFMKNKGYYPENDKIIHELIKIQTIDNNKVFWAMFTLASLAKDDNTVVKSFYTILKEKKVHADTLPLLDLEKIKRSWDKRMKGVNVSKFPSKEYKYLCNLFSKIEEGKTKDFFTVNKGNYLDISIDLDLVSQENKLNVNRNLDALTIFFSAFSKHIETNNDTRNVLSLSNFKWEKGVKSTFSLTFFYSDSSKEDTIRKIAGDLMGHALTKFDGTKLRGAEIRLGDIENNNKFFSAFILNYNLQNTLQTDKTAKTKKTKI